MFSKAKRITKESWEAHQKNEALKLMADVTRKIQKGQLKVVHSGLWTSGIDGGTTFRIDLKDSDS